jgi:transcriptional regulator with XRE-family HTH domain
MIRKVAKSPVVKIGDKIKNAREERRLSKVSLSKAIGISHSQLIKYENNVNTPSIERLRLIAKNLEYPLEYFTNEFAEVPDSAMNLEKYFKIVKTELPDSAKEKVIEYINMVYTLHSIKKAGNF